MLNYITNYKSDRNQEVKEVREPEATEGLSMNFDNMLFDMEPQNKLYTHKGVECFIADANHRNFINSLK